MNFQLTEQIKRENLWKFDNKCSWNGHVSNRLGLFDTYRFPPQKYISYIIGYCIVSWLSTVFNLKKEEKNKLDSEMGSADGKYEEV